MCKETCKMKRKYFDGKIKKRRTWAATNELRRFTNKKLEKSDKKLRKLTYTVGGLETKSNEVR